MPRHDMIDAMRGLGLKGMAGAFDEAVTTGLQRQRTTMEILTDLLRAEATHRHAASIRYPMAAAKLPVVKDMMPSTSRGRRSTRGWSVRCTAGRSCPHGAMSSWSVAPAPAKPICPPMSCALERGGVTSTPWIW